MKLVHISCILLVTTINCIASNNASTTEGDTNKPTNQQTIPVVNNTIPTTNSSNSTTAVNTTTNNTKDTVDSVTIVTNISTITVTPISNKTINDNITTVNPLISQSTLKPTTSTENTTITEKSIITSTIVNTPTINSSIVSSTPVITTVPVSTKVAPSYKERHFDGLSFLGGIILATGLMAIGALSWKFYRTLNEQNYRTL
ncbi:sialomucin core protein 24 [Apis florea]|uniref:sialomucin core protein 24 n=1 Tax=Apis florea TaxID=7463 RepID=UPI000252C4E7|nr:sialomucin core protein 24 [Apis florea]